MTLREEGSLLALNGVTTLEEVLAVTHSEDTSVDSPMPESVHVEPVEGR